MAYTKHFPEVPNTDEKCTNYVDGTTVLTAEHMGKIRDAIQADETYLAEVDPKITELESAKDNVVLVQSAQPASEDNKIWIPTTQGQEVEVPTYDEFTDLKSAIDNTADSLLEENNIPLNIEVMNIHPSYISNAASKGITVTVTGENSFRLNGTATAQSLFNLDWDVDAGKGLVNISYRPVYFLIKRSDGIHEATDSWIAISYFKGDGTAVGTNDKIQLFNELVPYMYNSAAAKTRNTFVIASGSTFNSVDFEIVLLDKKPLSEYVFPGMTTNSYDNIPLTFESKTGYYTNNGSFATYSNIWGATVNVTPTKKYRLNYMSYFGVSETVFFDSNGNLIQAVTSHNDTASYSKDFYAPVNATTMLIQAYGATEATVSGRTALSYQSGKHLDGSTLDVYEIPYKESNVGSALDILQNANKSVLFGKKIAYNGDSICESRLTGTAANGGGYAKLIADATGGTYDNKAVSGGILASAVPSGEMPHSVVNTLGQLPNDADLYCIEGGVNDFWRDVPLGDYSSTDYSASLDTTTVCGALEHIVRAITYYHVGKPLVFVLVHKATGTINANNAGYTFDQMREKMIGILHKYAVPYYDAYLYSGLNGYNSIQSTTFLTANSSGQGDGIHPNEAGYIRYYVPQLTALFESLMPIT